MVEINEIGVVAALGVAATCSNLFGAALGLYLPLSKRVLACVLAFAAGALICALAIELALEGAADLHRRGYDADASWTFVGGGFAIGAIAYFFASQLLDLRGAAIRYPT